jgi:hypothetical protein
MVRSKNLAKTPIFTHHLHCKSTYNRIVGYVASGVLKQVRHDLFVVKTHTFTHHPLRWKVCLQQDNPLRSE